MASETQAKTHGPLADLAYILSFAGGRRVLTYVGCALSALSMLLGFAPYVCIWLFVRELVAVAPAWGAAVGLEGLGWAAFWLSVASILLYMAGLMCTHLAAFRCAVSIRKRCVGHLMHAGLGYFDTHSSGELRRVVDGCARSTETLLAHKTPDAAGSVAMVAGMVALLFVFDWRMGLACLACVAVSVLSMFLMMGGESANFMLRYQQALVEMSRSGTEYVRGIPVVKVFQQTYESFSAFRDAIDEYSAMAENYAVKVCRVPQSLQLAVINSVACVLVPVALFLAPGSADLASLFCDFAFYAVFSAVVATAMTRAMFLVEEVQICQDVASRVRGVLAAPVLGAPARAGRPQDASAAFDHVTFAYDGADRPALDDVSLRVPSGATVALVGPSGGGKTTAASLVPRFWDVQAGRVTVGGVDVRDLDPHDLMDHVAFVFQDVRLFKGSVLDNVRAARPDASRAEVEEALAAARCDDIVAKLPQGLDTVVGAEGCHLSGGERQRVALARAILKDVPIVVLDEATAFADPENEALIQQALSRLCEGKTVLMVAHRLSTVVGADLVCVVEDGRVTEQGTHEELVEAGGTYARMWDDSRRAVDWRIERKEA